MNQDLQNLEIKVENEGSTPQGRLSATEWNIVVAAVKALDLSQGELDDDALADLLKPYITAEEVAQTYATQSSLNTLSASLNDFLSGSDTDTIINKWSELETFLSGLAESDNLATILSGKADKATTLAGYGITDAYTKAEINTTVSGLNTSIANLRTYANDTFVTLATPQRITARHDFIDGLKINGLPIYNSQDDVVYIDANLVVRGGITAWGTNEQTATSVFDALPIDGVTIKRDDNGVLYAVAGTGGLDETELANYLTTNNYATTSDITSALSGYATQSWVTGKGYLTGITSSMVTSALGYTPYNSANFTKVNIKSTLGISDWALASAKPTYTASEVGALASDATAVNSLNLGGMPATYRKGTACIPSIGATGAMEVGFIIDFHRGDELDNADYSTRLRCEAAAGNTVLLPQASGILALTSDIPTSLKNPNALSWSGYSSGSYDGSTAQSIALPTKLSQLTDDVVSGKYLSLAGGTVNGQIVSKGYDNYIAQGDTYTLIFGIGSGQVNRGIFDSANNSWMLYRDATTNILIPTGNLAIGGITATEKLHVYGNILATGGITAPTFTGVASNATYWNAYAVRPSSANIAVTGNTTLSHFLATGSMTTGKPAGDGTVLHFEWDTVAGFSHQVFFANNSNIGANNRMQWRAMDSGTWGEWKSVAFVDTGILKPALGLQINHIGSNYAEGIRLANRNGISNTWSEINFGCDPSATTGTHATQWTVGRNGNNNYFVIRNFGTDRIQIDLSGNTTLTGNFVATGGVTAQNTSDRRLKRNLRKFNASKVLMSLGAVWEYEYIDSEVQKNHIYGGTHYGLIYQHVKGTKLDVMCHEREDGMGALNYIHPKFISLIAGATMENISEVEKLKRKIRHLEAKVKQLESRA